MKISNSGMALYALLTSVILNCLGLVAMRSFAANINVIASLFIGYSIASLPLLSPSLSARPILPHLKKDSLLITIWALSIFTVYYLFIGFPHLVTPSQVILGLTLAPLIATFLSGDLSFKAAISQHKLKIAPILLLVFLALSEAVGRPHQSLWTLFLIIILFSLSQTSTRKLSKIDSPFYAQSRMAVIVAIMLFLYLYSIPTVNFSAFTVGFGIFFGLILTLVFRFTIYGIRNTSPIQSALLLSLNVPFSLTAEAILLGRKITLIQISLAAIYAICTTIIQIRMRENTQVPLDTYSKS